MRTKSIIGNLSGDNYYAARNMIQEIENAKTFCSYFEDSDLRWELDEMIQCFIKRVEKKINDNF